MSHLVVAGDLARTRQVENDYVWFSFFFFRDFAWDVRETDTRSGFFVRLACSDAFIHTLLLLQC